MHCMSWIYTCRPKKERGLGLRRLEDLIKAAGLKLICRLFNSKSLWAIWMQKRYLKNISFWDVSPLLTDSGTWKFMTELHHYAKSNMMKVIGNGSSTLLWHDPWTNEGRLVDLLGAGSHTTLTHRQHWRVSSLIHNQQWSLALPALTPI